MSDKPQTTLEEAEAELIAARENYRRTGPTHEAVKRCEDAMERVKCLKK